MKKMLFVLGLFLVLTGCTSMQQPVDDEPKLPDDYSDIIRTKYETSDDDLLNKMMYRVDIDTLTEMEGYYGTRIKCFIDIRFVQSIYDSEGIPQKSENELHISDLTYIDFPHTSIAFFVNGKLFPLLIGKPESVQRATSPSSPHLNMFIIPLSSEFLGALKVADKVQFLLNEDVRNIRTIAPRQLAAIKSLL